eukprot:6770854-Prymnesium_polylepis.1
MSRRIKSLPSSTGDGFNCVSPFHVCEDVLPHGQPRGSRVSSYRPYVRVTTWLGFAACNTGHPRDA